MQRTAERAAARPEWERTLSDKLWHAHWPLVVTASLIAAVGVAALYSAAGGAMAPWAERHLLRFVAGLGLLLAVAMVPLRVWMAAAWPAYLVSLALRNGEFFCQSSEIVEASRPLPWWQVKQ